MTTIAYPKPKIGEQAAQLLIDLMEDRVTEPPYTTTLDVTLIERESTAQRAGMTPKGK